MIWYANIIAVALSIILNISNPKLDEVRMNYEHAVTDKNLCRQMIQTLSTNDGNAVNIAYYGAYQTIWAKHVFNPIDKLNTFNKGKRNINKAALLSPDNIDVIFVRHSVQKNCPAFLGYRSNLKEDEAFLKQHLQEITSTNFRQMVISLLNSK